MSMETLLASDFAAARFGAIARCVWLVWTEALFADARVHFDIFEVGASSFGLRLEENHLREELCVDSVRAFLFTLHGFQNRI